MYKKLDEIALVTLLEAGIDEFADKGLNSANINIIAKNAGLSVGVIYKYYRDKDSFFLACVEHSLKLLETAIQDALQDEEDVMHCMEILIKALLDGAEKHRNYYIMYNEITSGSCRKYAVELAHKIEGKTSMLYAALVEKAQAEGKAVSDGNPRMFAFFFDSLLMMLQYAFSCEYYKERMKIFCGEDVFQNQEELASQFLKFMKGAIGIGEGL